MAIAAILAIFAYWAAINEVTDEMFAAPNWDNHAHYLVAFTLRYPSEIYSRLVRIEGATYSDQGGRFVQVNSWVYENPVFMATDADENTLSGLRAVENYAPSGKRTTTFMFKLQDNAYVESSTNPLKLPTGPYSVSIRYRVLWFTRMASFTLKNHPEHP